MISRTIGINIDNITMIQMVTFSKTDRMTLQDVSISEIKEIMNEKYQNSYSRLNILSEGSTEIIYSTKHKGNNTTIKLSRETHRPLDLKITVAYKDGDLLDDSFKSFGRKIIDFSSSFMGAVIWFVVILIMIYVLFVVGLSYLLFLTSSNLLFTLLFVVIAIIAFQFMPNFKNSAKQKKLKKLDGLIIQIKEILTELQEGKDGSTKKCWNCFEQIDNSVNNCPFCGKYQQ